MDAYLNIVDLIEKNPITRLSGTYQHKLLIKIKSKFDDAEQQMFVASFYCYLNYNQRTEYVITPNEKKTDTKYQFSIGRRPPPKIKMSHFSFRLV